MMRSEQFSHLINIISLCTTAEPAKMLRRAETVLGVPPDPPDGMSCPRAPGATLSKALRIAFNPRAGADRLTEQLRDAITWVKRHSGTVRDLEDVDAFRRLMAALDKKGDGTRQLQTRSVSDERHSTAYFDYAIEKTCST